MRRTVVIASAIGFVVPILWGCASFLLFNMKESTASRLFWGTVYTTCPFWVLPGLWGSVAMPFLNAALYGLVGFLIGILIRKPVGA